MVDLIKRRYPEDPGEIRPERTLEGGTRSIQSISFGQPLRWLRQGWRDLLRAPSALLHGLVFSVAGVVLVWATWAQPWLSLALVIGFLLVGPALAVSLNATARNLEAGQPAKAPAGLGAITEIGAPLWLFAAILLGIFAVWTAYTWLWIAVMNVGQLGLPAHIGELLSAMLASPGGIVSLVGVLIIGAAFALVAFAMSVITVPAMLDQRSGLVDAVAVSLKAFKRNPVPLLFWALLITALFLVSVLTAFVALIVIFPWLGLAMWHGYRDLVGGH
nr:DUF2189 domain-containing protein [Thioalkalivibrio sp.]